MLYWICAKFLAVSSSRLSTKFFALHVNEDGTYCGVSKKNIWYHHFTWNDMITLISIFFPVGGSYPCWYDVNDQFVCMSFNKSFYLHDFVDLYPAFCLCAAPFSHMRYWVGIDRDRNLVHWRLIPSFVMREKKTDSPPLKKCHRFFCLIA